MGAPLRAEELSLVGNRTGGHLPGVYIAGAGAGGQFLVSHAGAGFNGAGILCPDPDRHSDQRQQIVWGRLAQLVQSACLTSRRSAVQIGYRPL